MNEAHDSCAGCRHDLGGGRDNCRLNLAYECRDGGGFEAWEPKEEVQDQAQNAHRTPFLVFFGLTCALIGAIAYKWAALM